MGPKDMAWRLPVMWLSIFQFFLCLFVCQDIQEQLAEAAFVLQ